MKTFFTLLLSTLITLTTMAFDGTRLTVSTLSTQKMFVEVDGRRFNFNGNTVSFTNMTPGIHNIRVIRQSDRRGGFNYGHGRSREQVIYNIKATIKNGFHFDILVNRFGKVMIDERRIDQFEDWYNEDEYYGNGSRPDRNDRNWEDNQDYPGRDDRYDRNSRDDRDDDYYDNRSNNYYRSMNANDFSLAKESLRKEWLENNRLSAAKQVVDDNYLSSQQVKEMLLLFTFENNRLELAQYAYGNTIDKENYFIVNDAFTFNSNKDKLARYIRDYKENK